MGTKLILPLMMWGKVGNYWHEQGQPIRKKVKVGETVFKTGARKGKPRPIYDWVIATKKTKIVVGHDGHYKSGKNKGKHKLVYETRDLPMDSTGIFPSANRIYINAGGGVRRLNTAAEDKLKEWHNLSRIWAQKNKWMPRQIGTKVIADMIFYLPDDSIRDTHNVKKLLLDSLEGIIHENDMWILDRTIDFKFDKNSPRIEIEFREYLEG
jgi:Holliday junction resolvase RusA-like endonuclease